MKQEIRFVAEVYRYLRPFIDSSKEVYLCLDGQAAERGVQEGLFTDATIPDLWFTLIGDEAPTRIEAKVIGRNGRLLVMQSQLQAWRTGGHGRHLPHSWIACNESFTRYFIWTHEDFRERMDATNATGLTVSLLPPTILQEYANIEELALYLLRQ